MIEPSTYQCRAWERRAVTIQLKASALLDDVLLAIGAGHELTDHADNVLSYAEDLVHNLSRYPDMLKARKTRP